MYLLFLQRRHGAERRRRDANQRLAASDVSLHGVRFLLQNLLSVQYWEHSCHLIGDVRLSGDDDITLPLKTGGNPFKFVDALYSSSIACSAA